MRKLLVVLALAALVVPAFGQGGDFTALLSGKDVPSTVQVKTLNADWRRVTISSPGSQSGLGDMMKQIMQSAAMSGGGGRGQDAMGAMMAMSMFGGQNDTPVYYTRGQTITVAGETFLVAYRYEKPEMNFMQLIAESEKTGKEPDFAKLAADAKMTPESNLTLALVNVKSIGTMAGIRAFDLNKELAENAGGGLLEMLATQRSAQPAASATVEATSVKAPKATTPPAKRNKR